MTQLISDDVLDGMARGWTPEQVRNLVAKYREAKVEIEAGRRAIATYGGIMHAVSAMIARTDEQATRCAQIPKVERVHDDGSRTLVDGPAFADGMRYVRNALTEALRDEAPKATP